MKYLLIVIVIVLFYIDQTNNNIVQRTFTRFKSFCNTIQCWGQIIAFSTVALTILFPKLYKSDDYENFNIKNWNMLNPAEKRKRSVNERLKKVVAANQSWKCALCKNVLNAAYEIDHIVPLYKNGSNLPTNLQALCRNCHGLKTLRDSLE